MPSLAGQVNHFHSCKAEKQRLFHAKDCSACGLPCVRLIEPLLGAKDCSAILVSLTSSVKSSQPSQRPTALEIAVFMHPSCKRELHQAGSDENLYEESL
jgi:hypothetical protein